MEIFGEEFDREFVEGIVSRAFFAIACCASALSPSSR